MSSMTLNGVIALSAAYSFTEFGSFHDRLRKMVGDTLIYFLRRKCRPKNQVFSDISLTAIFIGDHP